MSDLTKCTNCGRLAVPSATVTIPADEYEALVQLRRNQEFGVVRLAKLTPRSRLSRDPEVAAFILASADTMIIRELHATCQAQFGPARTPSKTAIHRFVQRHRG